MRILLIRTSRALYKPVNHINDLIQDQFNKLIIFYQLTISCLYNKSLLMF